MCIVPWYMLCDVFPYFSQRVGVTTTLPDSVPYELPLSRAGGHEWNYCNTSLFHNGSYSEFPHLPSLDNLTTNQSVGLLVTTNGQLHLYLDGRHVQEVATGLPVTTPLWGAVDVFGNCTKIKSEILSGELECVCSLVCFVYACTCTCTCACIDVCIRICWKLLGNRSV